MLAGIIFLKANMQLVAVTSPYAASVAHEAVRRDVPKRGHIVGRVAGPLQCWVKE